MADDYQDIEPGAEADDWREPPKWPKVVGIISIVWAVLGIVCNGLGAVGTMMTPRLMKMAEGQGQMEGGFPPQMTSINMLAVVLTVAGALTAVGLLLAGIFTVNRRPQGRPLHLLVAVVSLVLVVCSIGLQWQNMTAIGEWVRANPGATFSQNYSPTGSLVGMAFGIVLGCAWPVFCLIWFGALKKRPEQDAPEVL